MPQVAVCPDLTHYQQLAAGQLADADEAVLLEHLENCEVCAQKLNTLAEQDTLVELIRREQAQSDRAADGVIGRLVERLSKLRPGAAPAGAEETTPPAPEPVSVSPLVVACPTCRKGLKVKGRLAGKLVKCPHCQQVVCVPAASADVKERGTHAAPPAAARNVLPEPGSRLEASAVDGVNVLSGVTASRADQPRPAADENKKHYDFLAPPQAPDELGRLGPYRVLQVLGTGGMGVVFRAEDPQLARLVALKAMLPALAASASARQRFLREARAAAAINHDHIVSVHQVGEDRGVPYLAMQFLEGEPLDVRLQRDGKLPVAEVLRIGREIALGLEAAHQRGLIHRDIKPANIWLETHGKPGASASGGRVKILDFGLARAVGEEAQLTQQGAIVGTPAYMAPEQGQGQSVDHRCDLFSLGCVLYLLATGKPPFKGTAIVSTLIAVATENPRPPHELEAALPRALSELIMSLLAKEPGGRPPSAQAVAETLEHLAAVGAASRAAPSITPARLGSPDLQTAPLPRKKWPIMAGLAACLMLGLAGLWSAGVFKLKTQDGTIVVENLPADAEVFVDGEKVALKLPGNGKRIEIQVAPGKRKLEIKTAGFKMETREVTLASGERKPIGIRLEPLAAAPDKAALPREVPSVRPSAALEALRRDNIAAEALILAGNGDPMKAPAGLVGALGEVEPLQTALVRSLAFSADGRWLASASFDKTILLRDVATGRVQRALEGHTSWIMSVAFSKDGRTLVSASHDGTLKFWPVDKAAEPQTLDPKLGEIWGMAVSADGRFLAAGGTNGGVKLWKWGQWDTPRDLPGAAGKSWIHFNGNRNASLAFSADGEWLAVAREEEKPAAPIRLFRTADAKLGQTLPGYRAGATDLAFSRDGKYLASFVQGTGAFIWDLVSGKHVAEFPAAQFGSVSFSHDGKKLAVAGLWHVALYDVASKQRERVLPAGHGNCFPLAFSPDGQLLASGFTTGIVHVWDTSSWKEKYLERGHLHFIRGLAISPDGSTLLSVGDDDTLRRWDLARPGVNQILHRFNADHLVGASVAHSPDSRSFALVVSGDGYCGGPPEMSVWDAVATKLRWSLPLAPRSIAFSPDGKALAGACEDGGVRLWDTDQGRELHRFGALGAPGGLAFSRDGKLLAAVSQEKTACAKVWNVASGAEVHSWQDTSMTGVAFRPDGQVLAIGHGDGTISVWDLAEGKKKRTLRGHSAQVQSVKFTPAGKALISSGHDGTIRVWNPDWERAEQVIALGPANQRLVMDLDPSGTYLLAAGHGPVTYVLRIPRGDDPTPVEKKNP